MKKLPELDPLGYLKGCYIAGGAVLSTVTKTPISDYDIYPKTEEDFFDIVSLLTEDSDGFVVNMTDLAVTIKRNDVSDSEGQRAIFQVIVKPCKTPDEIFENFDFTVCMGAYDCDTKDYTFHESFWKDVASRTLNFNPKTLYPLASLFRIAKYKHKGYFIGKAQTAKIAIRLMQDGAPNSWEEFESQLGGVYGKSFKLVRKDKEFSVEALLEYLDDDFNLEYVDQEEFGDVEIESIVLRYSKDRSSYRKLELGSSTYIFKQKGEYFECFMQTDLFDNVEDIDSNAKIIGSKRLVVDGPEPYYPAIRRKDSKVRYSPGKETRQEDPSCGKYLFMYTESCSDKFPVSKDLKKFYAYTEVKDIVKITAVDIETKAITIGEEITE